MKRTSAPNQLPVQIPAQLGKHCVMYEVTAADVQRTMRDLCNQPQLLFKTIVATDDRQDHDCFTLWYIFVDTQSHSYHIPFLRLRQTTEFPSLAGTSIAAAYDERRIHTFFGLTPVGHPDPRPLILHPNWPDDVFPLRKDIAWQLHPAMIDHAYPFQTVTGDGIYEIPVGPIHAGIIEPGHFRFSMAGESILVLEPLLGFVHKGSEKLFETLPLSETVRLSEKISGDSSFSHSLAWCQAIESLSGITVPPRGRYLRVLYAELERLANHFGDCGAIMLDTGYNFGGAQGARLRELIMQLNDQLTDSRFLRSVNVFGGVTQDISDADCVTVIRQLKRIAKDFSEVIRIAENSTSLLNRLNDAGTISPEIVERYGVTGIAAKATGLARDVRIDFPYAAYNDVPLRQVATATSGDVYGRFEVRIQEVATSIDVLKRVIRELPTGPIQVTSPTNLPPNTFAINRVEGWRGEICYAVFTDNHGQLHRVAPRDPSFANWQAVSDAAFDNVIPDFPLINKSFNLSYSGNDL